jgi:opacity protein-like surface antigen
MRYAHIAAALAVAIATPLRAQSSYPALHVDSTLKDCSVKFASTLTQSAFHRFVREFGSVSAYKQSASASTLEPGRLMLGIEMINFTVDEHSPAWNDTFAHPNDHHPLGSEKSFPKLELRAGIARNMDVGVYFARNPNANYGWLGLDTKYRLLDESEGSPVNLAMRAAYTKTLYVRDMKMHSGTIDVAVGRQFWGSVRPYVGVGGDGVLARETSDAVNLHNENIFVPHVFGGADVTLWRRVTVGAAVSRGALWSTQVQVGAVAF